MKKIILLILILILLTGCSGVYNLNIFVLPGDTGFIEVVKSLRTPQEISDYMMRNFTYEKHGLYTPDPYTLWKTGRGDCNDMSTWGCFVANYHNYKTWQIRIFYPNDPFWQHWIAIYKEDIWLSFTDNQYYHPINATSFREIVEYDSYYLTGKIWIKFIVYDYWNNIVGTGYNN